MLPKQMFSPSEWREAFYVNGSQGRCLDCVERCRKGRWVCAECKTAHDREVRFSRYLASRSDKYHNGGKTVCNACWEKAQKRREGLWTCAGNCDQKQQDVDQFSAWLAHRRKKRPDGTQKCNVCVARDASEKPKVPRGHWPCKAFDCRRVLPKAQFSQWLAPRKDKAKNDGNQRCNDCMKKAVEVLQAQQRGNLMHVSKRARK